jgi:hypothetical protein
VEIKIVATTESPVTNHEPPIAVNEPTVSVPEESPVTAMQPSITGNEHTVSVDNGSSGIVEPSVDPTPDLSQFETPSNSAAPGNRLAIPGKWPVTCLRRSARLQSKKGNLARHLRLHGHRRRRFFFYCLYLGCKIISRLSWGHEQHG